MGANQSSAETRSVSMDNPTPSGVIDVSEEVVQRLKLGISKVKQQEKQQAQNVQTATLPIQDKPPATDIVITPPKTKPSPPKPAPSSSPAPAPAASTPSSESKAVAAAIAAAKQVVPPYPRFEGEPTITSMELRRQKERELRENNEFWKARIDDVEKSLNKTNEIMQAECHKAIEEVKQRLAITSGELPEFPCLAEKNKVVACYRENPNQTLNCADVCAQFSKCVAACRAKKLENLKRQQQQQAAVAAKGA